jgi:hypothetical protein
MIPVVLECLLWLHLIDENDDEPIMTVAANHGVELLGELSFCEFAISYKIPCLTPW